MILCLNHALQCYDCPLRTVIGPTTVNCSLHFRLPQRAQPPVLPCSIY
uniref:Uncharacterized protein n=1 Tax=Rhizophora mucronata TaxID=61149 RepID=A0A2P2P6F2_RHIMU